MFKKALLLLIFLQNVIYDNRLKIVLFLGLKNPAYDVNDFKMRKMKMNKNKKTFLETIVIASVLREK